MASAEKLIELFNEAKARPSIAERECFLAEACRDDPELLEQVLSLIQAHESARPERRRFHGGGRGPAFRILCEGRHTADGEGQRQGAAHRAEGDFL